jgi:hypothetical protein
MVMVGASRFDLVMLGVGSAITLWRGPVRHERGHKAIDRRSRRGVLRQDHQSCEQHQRELASSTSAGTLSGFDGTGITNFATLQFDAGADWKVTGNSLASCLGSIAITGLPLATRSA